jgi:hypothetical protein
LLCPLPFLARLTALSQDCHESDERRLKLRGTG